MWDLLHFRAFSRKTEGICKSGPLEKNLGAEGSLILKYMLYQRLLYIIIKGEKFLRSRFRVTRGNAI